MRPPLRERRAGADFERSALPESDRAFLDWLEGPTLIRLAGRDRTRTRILSTLLHGNEPSGLRASLGYLRSAAVPATDVLFFFGAVGAARAAPGFAHRALPGEMDANRCWHPLRPSPQGEVARATLERLFAANAECLVDLHNNTGHNPAYGVAFEIGPAERRLVELFADRVVHTPLELGTLVEATIGSFPSVTIECGRAGDPEADAVAARGLERYLSADRLELARPTDDLLVLEDPIRVCVAEGVGLRFDQRSHPEVALTISDTIDRHNFERLAPGTTIGWVGVRDVWPLEAIGPDGVECSRAIFEIAGEALRTRRAFIPIMMTTDEVVAKSDCLFYAVQPAKR